MTDEDRKPPIVLSRDELYSQIWTTPMIRLAAQYGITGTGLAKICARLNVPCPPRGYWAKKAADKPVVQYWLPEPEADTPLQVTITPAPSCIGLKVPYTVSFSSRHKLPQPISGRDFFISNHACNKRPSSPSAHSVEPVRAAMYNAAITWQPVELE